jgi:hypothetical protein
MTTGQINDRWQAKAETQVAGKCTIAHQLAGRRTYRWLAETQPSGWQKNIQVAGRSTYRWLAEAHDTGRCTQRWLAEAHEIGRST